MTRTKAFIDTTILTNILLKTGEIRTTSLEAMQRFEMTLLPVYALKEFKAGPLNNYKYIHNVLATKESYSETIRHLSRLSRTPHRHKTATSLEALAEAFKVGSEDFNTVQNKGITINIDREMCERSKIAIKTLIFKSWRKRRSVTTDVIYPIPCYREVAPTIHRGLIDLSPTKCQNNTQCSIQAELISRPADLQKMRDAIDKDSERSEDQKRLKILKDLIKRPKTPIADNGCRSLGDAIFAFFAPSDATILTTNPKDHRPLAESLGKKVETPY